MRKKKQQNNFDKKKRGFREPLFFYKTIRAIFTQNQSKSYRRKMNIKKIVIIALLIFGTQQKQLASASVRTINLTINSQKLFTALATGVAAPFAASLTLFLTNKLHTSLKTKRTNLP